MFKVRLSKHALFLVPQIWADQIEYVAYGEFYPYHRVNFAWLGVSFHLELWRGSRRQK